MKLVYIGEDTYINPQQIVSIFYNEGGWFVKMVGATYYKIHQHPALVTLGVMRA